MEEVRLLVQEEGRAARNLIAFHVPVDHSLSDSGKVVTRKPPTSPRLQTDTKKDEGPRLSKRSCESPKPGSRVRSASTGRDKKSELQARYWAFLFGNLQRAVDEIYQTCETDESVSECKEVILVLENYTKDFHNLIEWFKLKWEYENTPPPQRPTSLAWEVRKSSPGKIRPVTNTANVVVGSATEDDLAEVANSTLQSSADVKSEVENGEKNEPKSDKAEENSVVQSDVLVNKISESVSENVSTASSVLPTDSVEVINSAISNDTKTERETSPPMSSVSNTSALSNEALNTTKQEKQELNNSIQNIEKDLDSKNEKLEILGQNTSENLESIPSVGSVILEMTNSEGSDGLFVENNLSIKTEGNVLETCENIGSSAEIEMKKEIDSCDSSCISKDDGKASCDFNVEKDKTPDANIENTTQPNGSSLKTAVGLEESQNAANDKSACAGESAIAPVMVHQASQTDLEECIEDSDGIRFLSIPQKTVATTPVTVSKPMTVISTGPKTTTSTTRSSLATPRAGVRTTSVMPSLKPQPSVRPAYAAVSRLSSPANTRTLPLAQAGPIAPRPYTSPRLVRSRTSTDVRPAGRGMTVRKPSEPVSAPRPGVQQNGISLASVPPKVDSIPEKGPSLDRRSGSNSSLNSSASSGARSWADKVKGTESSHTTVSVEVLPRTGAGNEDDDTQGWETVKSRSRSRMSPANKVEGLGSSLSRSAGNIKCRPVERKGSVGLATRAYAAKSRYQQPSAATSLPALALIEVEVRPPTVKDGKKIADLKRNTLASSLVRKNSTNLAKMKKEVKDSKDESRKPLRSRSSLTLNKKANGKENSEKQGSLKDDKKDNIKEVASKSTVDSSQNENAKDMEVKEKGEETEPEGEKSIVIEVQEEKSDSGRKSDSETILLDVQLEDILEEKSLFNEEELRKSKELCAEEAMLRKEIHELETTEIEVDTETDETETDGEATIGPEDDDYDREREFDDMQKPFIIEDNMTLEARYETQLEGMSWAERVDALEQLEEMEARHPGRALELHQKLSSPSRRRTLPETLRCFQTKQAQAKEKRERLMQEKSQKLRELLNKVEEVKAAQAQLIEDKRARLEMKLKRAEVNRRLHLKGIVRKAHDEEEKLKEIAFINELEAQNKRHDFMALCQEERQRKQEEKAAKEAAVEERRRVLEAKRQERLEEMQEMRRKREERVGRKQQEREKERQELAREKARDREERLSALHAAQLATQEELQKKIQQKQEESARRHEENIEHIRQRALESSILRCSTDDVAPRLAPYDTQKLCEVCNVLIGSEVYLLSHLRGRKHQEAVQRQHEGIEPSREDLTSYNLKHIVDAPADKIDPKIALDKERQKALKKRCKKIRLRMAASPSSVVLGLILTKQLKFALSASV
ncbi:hypothetical protein C0J52_00443 [Blattella germanica]|nr:hypothetical protein C0J52_00443 [Blattella germanica]